MASGTFTFRPRREYEGDFYAIEEWCNENQIPFNALINSLLPALSYAVKNKTFIDQAADGEKIYILCDFGHVPIIKGKENQTSHEFFT